ncbi:NUDIX domain-containing protein [Synechococcus sp. UW140]|uniref:NUDIX hydrolase n=1 Tax=Synechococcus sp. UW140 TaxID=368503 RepID=UPI000E0F9395|nr:NUDIX domain-containing protein [Synechococcus sp. UW140]
MTARTEVAVAMLHQNDRWLLQLRDDVEGIIAPGCWGLFGGHLEACESAEVGLRRELLEEINLRARHLMPWFTHLNKQRLLHVFVGPLPVPVDALTLMEGQDLTLASLAQIQRGRIYSTELKESRALAGCMTLVVQQLRSNPPSKGH